MENQSYKLCVFYLPNEIIYKIFSYLDTHTLYRVQLVCKSWYELSCNAALWNSFSFKGNRNIVNISKVIIKYPLIKRLSISKMMLNSNVLQAISSVPLEEFCLTDCSYTGAETAFRNIMINASLKTLAFTNCMINDHILRHICEATSLKTLKIFFIDRRYLIPILEKCELKHLEIYNNRLITEEFVDKIFTLCSSTLKCLILKGEKRLEDSAFSHIDKCYFLSSLKLYRSDNLTDKTLLRLRNLPHIKQLCLPYGSKFTVKGLKTFLTGYAASCLVHLDLARCMELDDECVILIAHECKVLRFLCLNDCFMLTDESISHIALCCKNLETLDVSCNQYLQGAFLEIMKHETKNLKILDLRSCKRMKRPSVLSLESCRPSLKIYK